MSTNAVVYSPTVKFCDRRRSNGLFGVSLTTLMRAALSLAAAAAVYGLFPAASAASVSAAAAIGSGKSSGRQQHNRKL